MDEDEEWDLPTVLLKSILKMLASLAEHYCLFTDNNNITLLMPSCVSLLSIRGIKEETLLEKHVKQGFQRLCTTIHLVWLALIITH